MQRARYKPAPQRGSVSPWARGFWLAIVAAAFTPGLAGRGTAAAPRRFAQDPFVLETCQTIVRFLADGTSERRLSARVRIQSDAGAQQFRELVFTYDNQTEQLQPLGIRILNSSGAVLSESKQPSVSQLVSPLVPGAPAYSRYKQMRIPLPPLTPGETLEYEILRRETQQGEPGNFWLDFSFRRDAIVLDERLIVIPPRGIAPRISSPGVPYTRTLREGRLAYEWKRANLRVVNPVNPAGSEETVSDPLAALGRASRPDVRLTTFADWNAVAAWYARAEQRSMESSADVNAKAAELTRGAAGDTAKAKIVYDYAAQNIQHIAVPGGFSWHAPRSASEVLRDGYADAADEQALFLALLRGARVPASAALVCASPKCNAAFPSPGDFDRVVTALPAPGKPGNFFWLDTSPGVAPFGLLAPRLRGRVALVIPAAEARAAQIARIPADPPFLETQKVEMEASIDPLGKLSGTIHYVVRGDTELLLRAGFRAAPPQDWKTLAQTILALDGLQAEVASVVPSPPLDTREPFQLEIGFAQPGFLDWSRPESRTAVPSLAIGLPEAPARGKPIQLGSPLQVAIRLELRAAAGFALQPPVGTAVSRDYAAFRSSYRLQGQSLVAERELDFKRRSIPPAYAADYAAFARAVRSDQRQPLVAIHAGASVSAIPDASADELVETAAALDSAGKPESAIPLLQRAVALVPRHPQAWRELGVAYAREKKAADALAAFQKHTEVNPKDARGWDYLGITLANLGQEEKAAEAFRQALALDPLDAVAYPALGDILLRQRKFAEAVGVLEKGAAVSQESAALRLQLAEAYLGSGQEQKARSAFAQALELARSPALKKEIAKKGAAAGLAASPGGASSASPRASVTSSPRSSPQR